MKIESGAATKFERGEKIEEVKVMYEEGRTFQLWINNSLSYLTMSELLDLKDEIKDALEGAIM